MLKFTITTIIGLVCTMAFGQNFSSFEKQEIIRDGDTLRYRIQYPLNYKAGDKYPLVMVLHGSGERGYDNEAQLVWGGKLFADSANRMKYPAIVIFPQCPSNTTWARMTVNPNDTLKFVAQSDQPISKPLGLVIQLLDSMSTTGKVNTKKIYVGGLSMGGMGTFEILWRKPNFFAAAFPICGAGDPFKVSVYGLKFPIWVFHGDQDRTVPPGNSRMMVSALMAARANVKYSEYPGVQHDSWKNAFAEPDFLHWLFKKSRKG